MGNSTGKVGFDPSETTRAAVAKFVRDHHDEQAISEATAFNDLCRGKRALVGIMHEKRTDFKFAKLFKRFSEKFRRFSKKPVVINISKAAGTLEGDSPYRGCRCCCWGDYRPCVCGIVIRLSDGSYVYITTRGNQLDATSDGPIYPTSRREYWPQVFYGDDDMSLSIRYSDGNISFINSAGDIAYEIEGEPVLLCIANAVVRISLSGAKLSEACIAEVQAETEQIYYAQFKKAETEQREQEVRRLAEVARREAAKVAEDAKREAGRVAEVARREAVRVAEVARIEAEARFRADPSNWHEMALKHYKGQLRPAMLTIDESPEQGNLGVYQAQAGPAVMQITSSYKALTEDDRIPSVLKFSPEARTTFATLTNHVRQSKASLKVLNDKASMTLQGRIGETRSKCLQSQAVVSRGVITEHTSFEDYCQEFAIGVEHFTREASELQKLQLEIKSHSTSIERNVREYTDVYERFTIEYLSDSLDDGGLFSLFGIDELTANEDGVEDADECSGVEDADECSGVDESDDVSAGGY